MKLLFDFITIGGIILIGLILVLLTKSKSAPLSKKLLIAFFILLLLEFIHGYASLHNLPIIYLITFIFTDPSSFFMGPLLFIYIKSLFLPKEGLLRKNWLHFLPAVFYILFLSLPILFYAVTDKDLTGYIEKVLDFSTEASILINLYLLTYLILSLQLFQKYRKVMQSNYSNFSENEFGWVKYLLLGAMLIVSIDLFTLILEVFHFIDANDWSEFFTYILIAVFITFLGYFGLNQSKVLLPDFLIQEIKNETPSITKIDYLANRSEEELIGLRQQLERVMMDDRPYLDEDLTLNKLAQKVSITDKKLSSFLNQYLETTFYNYVNKHRVEAVKMKIQSKQFDHLTLLGIAYESGFKSKTSFNRIFKKETGQSPTEFKKGVK